jgi:ABC-2 type transport system ATP-binding protein
MTTITISNITKAFGKTYALKDVSLTLESDRIYGLLGRNGAGKTTLINVITNKIFATTGEVLIDDENAVENDLLQSRICCMTEKTVHPRGMKVKHGFRWAQKFNPSFDMEYAAELAEKFELDTSMKIHSLSSGFTSVFKLILTLASGVPILIFDEPVLGLDAANRELFYRLLIEYYSEHPKTIIISTHLIDEVAEILEYVIIIRQGEIVLNQPVEKVLQHAYSVSGDSAGVDEYSRGKNVIHEESIGKFKAVTIYQERNSGDEELIRKLGLDTGSARLQELFINLTDSPKELN